MTHKGVFKDKKTVETIEKELRRVLDQQGILNLQLSMGIMGGPPALKIGEAQVGPTGTHRKPLPIGTVEGATAISGVLLLLTNEYVKP